MQWRISARSVRRTRRVYLSLTIVFLAIASDAHAYIDPGSGALIWQALVAGCIGLLFYIRSIARTVRSWIDHLKQKATGKAGKIQ